MSSPAGWYPQPDGQQRYWDGQQWTENFAPGVSPETPLVAPIDTRPGASPQTPPGKARENWFLRHKILSAIGALLLIGIFANLGKGGGTKIDTAAIDATGPVVTATSPDKAAADKVAADKVAADKVVAAAKAAADKVATAAKAAAAPQLGKTVRDGKFAFTVTAVKCGIAQVGTNELLIQKAQGQYCRASLTVENIGNEAQTMFASNQYLFDSKGRKFTADATANLYDDSAKLMFEAINPGNSLKGFVYFDVPKGTVISKLELHDSAFSGGVEVRL